jgi:hypothetical protein
MGSIMSQACTSPILSRQLEEEAARARMAAEDAVRDFQTAIESISSALSTVKWPPDLLRHYVAGFDTEAIEPPASPPRSEAEFLAQRRAQLRAGQQAKGRNRVKPWEAPAKRFR